MINYMDYMWCEMWCEMLIICYIVYLYYIISFVFYFIKWLIIFFNLSVCVFILWKICKLYLNKSRIREDLYL